MSCFIYLSIRPLIRFSLLCVEFVDRETLIRIRGVSISKNALTGLFLNNEKISLDIMRAFLICFRSDNHSRTKFFFLPQSMVSHYPQLSPPPNLWFSLIVKMQLVQESIEGGELERDFLQALDQDMRSKQSVRNSRLVSVFHVSCMDVYVWRLTNLSL